ncbi:MAG: hypothetical protein N4J56_006824 [Chroococcidiopsis sp. SAG 2025]|nr:hypothetical protein [Chroococcidiopsis sp. SAG 2025]
MQSGTLPSPRLDPVTNAILVIIYLSAVLFECIHRRVADWVLQYTDLAVYCLILQIVILGLDKNVL